MLHRSSEIKKKEKEIDVLKWTACVPVVKYVLIRVYQIWLS